jgi:hypothetical protein
MENLHALEVWRVATTQGYGLWTDLVVIESGREDHTGSEVPRHPHSSKRHPEWRRVRYESAVSTCACVRTANLYKSPGKKLTTYAQDDISLPLRLVRQLSLQSDYLSSPSLPQLLHRLCYNTTGH